MKHTSRTPSWATSLPAAVVAPPASAESCLSSFLLHTYCSGIFVISTYILGLFLYVVVTCNHSYIYSEVFSFVHSFFL